MAIIHQNSTTRPDNDPTESKNGDSDSENRDDSSQKMARNRTDWAEDRTLMANERTFAGWMRTGMATVGIGIGFNALFSNWQPVWIPKAIASGFIVIGIFIFYAAQQRGCAVYDRLQSHAAEPLGGVNLRAVAGALAFGGIALIAGIWFVH